ncbi:MAG: pseudouridine synthase [Phycisphaerae bacterium]
MARERIQKVLASAGFGSRRACESLVEAGRVSVNGRRVWTLPVLVDPKEDRILVDRKPIRPERLVYYLLNKPPGYYCTNNDPAGRKRAIDLMKGVRERVFPVGRLDASSLGLLFMTNDGDLAARLTHPRFGVPKTYRAEVTGRPTQGDLERLRKGVWLSEGKTGPAEVSIIHKARDKTILEITLREGRNREVRRMLAKLGHKVRRLSRIRVGRLSIRKLALGEYRPLTKTEVAYLLRLSETEEARAEQRSPPRSSPKSRRKGTAPRRTGSRKTGDTVRKKTSTGSKRGPERSSGIRSGERSTGGKRDATRKRRIILPEE